MFNWDDKMTSDYIDVRNNRIKAIRIIRETLKKWNGKVYTKNFREDLAKALRDGMGNDSISVSEGCYKDCIGINFYYTVDDKYTTYDMREFCNYIRTLNGGFSFDIIAERSRNILFFAEGKKPRINYQIIAGVLEKMEDEEEANINEVEMLRSKVAEIDAIAENVRRAAAPLKDIIINNFVLNILKPWGSDFNKMLCIEDPAETTTETTETTEEEVGKEITPINAATGKPYTGSNAEKLLDYLKGIHSTDGRFFPWRGMHDAGYLVRKGESGIPLTMYKDGRPTSFPVWHVSQLVQKVTEEAAAEIKETAKKETIKREITLDDGDDDKKKKKIFNVTVKK